MLVMALASVKEVAPDTYQGRKKMKKSSVVLNIVAAVVLCWAIMFKLMVWYGGNVMLMIALVLSVVATVCSACDLFKSGKLGKGIVVYNAIALILTFVGICFRAFHYPGGNLICILSMALLLPIAIVWSAVVYMKGSK